MKAFIYIGATSTLIGYASAGLHQHIHDAFYHVRRYKVEDRNDSGYEGTGYGDIGYGGTSYGGTTTYIAMNAEPTLNLQAFINTHSSISSATSFSSIPLPSSSPPEPNPSTKLPDAVPTISSTTVPPSEVHRPAPEPVQNAPPKPAPNPFKKATPLPVAKPTATISHSSEPTDLSSESTQWCVTYSPYNADGSCKDQSSVSSDIAVIASKGFSSVRLYSTDCSGLQNVGSAAKSHGLKLVLGVFLSENGLADGEAQISEIVSWAAGDWADVEMIVAGNEAVFNEYCTAEDLARFITSAKDTFRKAGYSGPITTSEPINILSEYSGLLCPIVDIIAANIHPFFNDAITADKAGDFVSESLRTMEGICPGLESYNLETGWPSVGLSNGAAVPGPNEQRTAIEGIMKAAGRKSAFLGFADDAWKAKGEFEVEPHWGCSHLFEV